MYKDCKVTHILAVSKDGFIGNNNTIPWKSKTDMTHFSLNTKGKVCIMGRKTFESIVPPLRNRIVIVVTSKAEQFTITAGIPDHGVVGTVAEALEIARSMSLDKEIMIIGGKTIYNQTLDYVDQVLLSTIDIELKQADTKMDWSYPDRVDIVPFEFQVNA